MLDKQKNLLSIALIIIIGFAAYGNSLNNPFVWDDHPLIVSNYNIDNAGYLLIKPLYPQAPDRAGFAYYRPLQALSYSLDYRIWGLKPFGFRLTNLILHLLNAFLIYLLIRGFTADRIIGLITSGFFLLNPIFVSSVGYISGRADLMLLFFVLLSFKMLQRFQLSQALSYYVLSLTFFFTALISKESAVLALFIFILYLMIYSRSKNKLLIWLGYFAVFLFYVYIRSQVFSKIDFLSFNCVWPDLLLPNTIKAFLLYAALLFFPLNPSLGRTVLLSKSFAEPIVLVSILFLFLVALLIYHSHKTSNKIVLFGVLWYALSVIPLSIFNYIFASSGNEVIMPENILYLASPGFLCVLAYALGRFLRPKNIFSLSLVVIYFILLCTGTISANRIWGNETALFEHLLKTSRNSGFAYILYANLGLEHKKKGNLQQAIECYNYALKIKKEPSIYQNLGNIYFIENNLAEAKKHYLEAIRLSPHFALAYVGLGCVFLKDNNVEKAEEMFAKAIEIDPTDKQVQQAIAELMH